MAVHFGLVSVVAVTMCAGLISLIAGVSGLVHDMRDDEIAIKESLALAASVREQYIHQAHWLIERDETPGHQDEEWLQRVVRGVESLRSLVPASEQERLESIVKDSNELDQSFRSAIQPAARRGNRSEVIRLHRQTKRVSQRATQNADAIARAVETQMAKIHTSATQATTLGLIGGGICVVLVLTLAVVFTLKLRRSVLKPLDVLTRAARRFGCGDFQNRVGDVGEGELLAVAQAFDRMVAELEQREKRLIANERMAAIGQLAAGVAHEINNPIQIIRGYLKTMGPRHNSGNIG